MDTPLEIIDAFVDGERVEAAALKRALADDAGRDYFVDAWLLREEVQDEITREVSPAAAPSGRRYPMWVAAAVVTVALGGGYVVGYRAAPRVGPAPVAVGEPAPPSRLFPAPTPTRTIQMEFPTDGETRGED